MTNTPTTMKTGDKYANRVNIHDLYRVCGVNVCMYNVHLINNIIYLERYAIIGYAIINNKFHNNSNFIKGRLFPLAENITFGFFKLVTPDDLNHLHHKRLRAHFRDHVWPELMARVWSPANIPRFADWGIE